MRTAGEGINACKCVWWSSTNEIARLIVKQFKDEYDPETKITKYHYAGKKLILILFWKLEQNSKKSAYITP